MSEGPEGGWVRQACGQTLLVLSVAILLGWWFGYESVTRVLPGTVTMKANTALGLLLVGTGLLARHRAVTQVLGALLLALGAVTLLGYLGVVDVTALDQLLVEDRWAVPTLTSHPGRMSPTTASSFVVLGMAMIARRGARILLGGAVWWCGLVSTAGYLLRVDELLSVWGLTQMAIHTAAGLLLGALGILAAERSHPWLRGFGGTGLEARNGRAAAALGIATPLLGGTLAKAGVWAGHYDIEVCGAIHVLFAAMAHLVGLWVLHRRFVAERATLRAREAEADEAARRMAAAAELARRLERRLREDKPFNPEVVELLVRGLEQ